MIAPRKSLLGTAATLTAVVVLERLVKPISDSEIQDLWKGSFQSVISQYAPSMVANMLDWFSPFGAGIVTCSLVIILVEIVIYIVRRNYAKNRMPDEQKKEGGKLDEYQATATGRMDLERNMPGAVNVTSSNQSGGITAHTVLAKTPPRKINEHIKASILHNLPKNEPIGVCGIMANNESIILADEIRAFVESEGYIVHPRSYTQAMFDGPAPIGIKFTRLKGENYITVLVGINGD